MLSVSVGTCVLSPLSVFFGDDFLFLPFWITYKSSLGRLLTLFSLFGSIVWAEKRLTYTFPKVFKLRESMSDSWAAGTGLKKMFSLFLRPPIVRMLAIDWALPYSCGVPMELGPKASRVRSVSFFSRLVASWSILLVTCGLLLGETLSSLLCVCTELPFLKTLRVFTFSVCDCFFSNSSFEVIEAWAF